MKPLDIVVCVKLVPKPEEVTVNAETRTLDRAKARSGGSIFAAGRTTPEDDEALRMSEAVLVGSGGLLSHAALSARRHSIPALTLPQGRWDKEGLSVQAAEKTVPRVVREGEVLTIDPIAGRIILYPPELQEFELGLAQAMRAYGGLKDAQALIQWFEAGGDENKAPVLGSRLIEEMAQLLVSAAAKPEDVEKVRRAVLGRLTAADREQLRAKENLIFERQLKTALSRLGRIKEDLARAGSFQAAERLQFEAQEDAERLKALSSVLGVSSGLKSAQDAYFSVKRRAAARAKALRGRDAGSLMDAVSAAGAFIPKSARLSGDFYRRFLTENNLAPVLEEISLNASLSLATKSRRIRDLIEAARLAPDSALGRDILRLMPPGDVFILKGEQAARRYAPRSGILAAVKGLWGQSWNPQALGERKRSGSSLVDPILTIESAQAAEVSGVIFSRDPVSGRGDRLIVGSVLGLSEESSSLPLADQHVLDSRSGREILPALIADKREKIELDARQGMRRVVVAPGLSLRRCLSPRRLEQLARLARALDNHSGYGVEIGFALGKSGLAVLWTRPMKEAKTSSLTPPSHPR